MSEIPKVVHVDAIHETHLIYGVKAEVGKPDIDGSWEFVRGENAHRYHIASICRIIADEFFGHRGEINYIPQHPHLRCPIKELVSDRDFETHAKYEFEGLNRSRSPGEKIEEEIPIDMSGDGPVNELTRRFVEAFQKEAIEHNGNGRLELSKMREIRDRYFRELESSNKKDDASQRSLSSEGRVIYPRISVEEFRRAQQKQRKIDEDDSGECDPTYLLFAGVFACALGIAKFAGDLFAEDSRRDQRVSRVNKSTLGLRMERPAGRIY